MDTLKETQDKQETDDDDDWNVGENDGWLVCARVELFKLFSPKLRKYYFLNIHKQIRSKVPIFLPTVESKRPFGNC